MLNEIETFTSQYRHNRQQPSRRTPEPAREATRPETDRDLRRLASEWVLVKGEMEKVQSVFNADRIANDFRVALSIGFRDYTTVLHLLKLGVIINLYFLFGTLLLASKGADPYIVVPAEILFAVSAYRCLLPVRYEYHVVFHEGRFSSIFGTRLAATFAEIAWIYLFSHVLRMLNVNHVGWVIVVSWLMVVQVVISQCCVWTAILTERLEFYFYEESGWLLIFAANAIASAYLYMTVGAALGDRAVLLVLSILFGIAYMPFEVLHLGSLNEEMKTNGEAIGAISPSKATPLLLGLKKSIQVKNPRTDAAAWGGMVGLVWMIGYFATLVPMWIYYIAHVLGPR